AARTQVEEIGGLHRHALDEQPVAAVREAHGTRHAVLVLLGHPRRPAFGRHFEVPVTGNQPILPGHKSLLLSSRCSTASTSEWRVEPCPSTSPRRGYAAQKQTSAVAGWRVKPRREALRLSRARSRRRRWWS